MVYDNPVDGTYIVPKYNKDPEEDKEEDKEEEAEDPGYNPMWISHVHGQARTLMVTSKLVTSTSEEEEKVTWAICPNCHRNSKEGGVCTNCEDMGMIYNIPLEDKGTNLQNHDDIDQELHGCSDKTPKSGNDNEEEEHDKSQELGGTVHDWSQVNQVGNEEQKLNKWLIDSSASVHVTNEKQDLQEPKPKKKKKNNFILTCYH